VPFLSDPAIICKKEDENMNISEQTLIARSPDVLGGTPVFAGTRVPVQLLFDYLESEHSLSDFLEDFPTVTRQQATAVLELMKQTLLAAV
jgi:uncharacterized protein (DUF433 family)